MTRNTRKLPPWLRRPLPADDSFARTQQILDSLGAEIIIPLYATGGIKGWIFIGQRATGIPFDVPDLEDLTGLAEHISTTLEKAMQYEETALQKALAETLLHSIPFGIVACDENATIRWFNSTAREILQTEAETIIGVRAENLGSRIAEAAPARLRSEQSAMASRLQNRFRRAGGWRAAGERGAAKPRSHTATRDPARASAADPARDRAGPAGHESRTSIPWGS